MSRKGPALDIGAGESAIASSRRVRPPLSQPQPRPRSDLSLDRGLVQRPPPPLVAGLPQPGRPRRPRPTSASGGRAGRGRNPYRSQRTPLHESGNSNSTGAATPTGRVGLAERHPRGRLRDLDRLGVLRARRPAPLRCGRSTRCRDPAEHIRLLRHTSYADRTVRRPGAKARVLLATAARSAPILPAHRVATREDLPQLHLS
jgi:hypothetical protein